jgi:hypothetical protein
MVFGAHFSIEKGAFSLINSILTAMNNKQIVGSIFCDLQKAINCVDHKILLKNWNFVE